MLFFKKDRRLEIISEMSINIICRLFSNLTQAFRVWAMSILKLRSPCPVSSSADEQISWESPRSQKPETCYPVITASFHSAASILKKAAKKCHQAEAVLLSQRRQAMPHEMRPVGWDPKVCDLLSYGHSGIKSATTPQVLQRWQSAASCPPFPSHSKPEGFPPAACLQSYWATWAWKCLLLDTYHLGFSFYW